MMMMMMTMMMVMMMMMMMMMMMTMVMMVMTMTTMMLLLLMMTMMGAHDSGPDNGDDKERAVSQGRRMTTNANYTCASLFSCSSSLSCCLPILFFLYWQTFALLGMVFSLLRTGSSRQLLPCGPPLQRFRCMQDFTARDPQRINEQVPC